VRGKGKGRAGGERKGEKRAKGREGREREGRRGVRLPVSKFLDPPLGLGAAYDIILGSLESYNSETVRDRMLVTINH